MKKLLLSAVGTLIFGITILAQPQIIPYQAVARDGAGNPLTNKSFDVRFSITDGAATPTIYYRETHSVTTNLLGLFVEDIGTGGTGITGTFSSIPWSTNSVYLQVDVDLDGSGNFATPMGVSQMLSVPYALYCGSSGSGLPGGVLGNTLFYGSSGWTVNSFVYNDGSDVGIGLASGTTPSALLDIAGTYQSIRSGSGGTFVSTNSGSIFGTPNTVPSPFSGLAGSASTYYNSNSIYVAGVVDGSSLGGGISSALGYIGFNGTSGNMSVAPSSTMMTYSWPNMNEQITMDNTGINMNTGLSDWSSVSTMSASTQGISFTYSDNTSNDNYISIGNNGSGGRGIGLSAGDATSYSNMNIDPDNGFEFGTIAGQLLGLPANGKNFFNGDLTVYAGTSGTSGTILAWGNVFANGYGGNISNPYVSSYTLQPTDYTIIVTNWSTTLTLPTPGSSFSQQIYNIVNKSPNNITISAYVDLTNNTVTSIAPATGITLQYDGFNWQQIK